MLAFLQRPYKDDCKIHASRQRLARHETPHRTRGKLLGRAAFERRGTPCCKILASPRKTG